MKKILFILIAVASAFVFQIAGLQSSAQAEWGEDVLVTNYIPDYNSIKPSMDEAPNGDLYIAVEEGGQIRVYKSMDGGDTWGSVMVFASGNYAVNPSLAYAAGTEDWVFIVYEEVNDDSRSVRLFRFNPADPWTSNFATIASGLYMPPDVHIQPEICTDAAYFDDSYFVYVTYSEYDVDGYRVSFSRSLNKGLNWTIPQFVDSFAGTPTTGWQIIPDIAFGSSGSGGYYGLYITFEKMGWNGSSWNNQIWVTKSADYGLNWNTPLQLTSSAYDNYHPRIAAASNNAVMVAYANEYVDIESHYSTDGGTSWYPSYTYLPSDPVSSVEVELAVSTNNGRFHAAYWFAGEILYSWADATNPGLGWSSPAIIVNELYDASANFMRPAVCPNPTLPVDQEACVAWTDTRNYPNPTYDVYFDHVSVCGDGWLSSEEQCDDGNTLNADCCSATCMFEANGSPCGNQDTTACTYPDSCTGDGYCSPNNEAAGTQCNTDGNMCTDDECDGLGVCIHINNTDPCDDYLFCTGADTCSGGTCSVHSGDPCFPLLCDEIANTCSGGSDFDDDGVPDSQDNCIYQYNPGQEDLDSDGMGDACDNCIRNYNPGQEDTYPPQTNGCGDACECEGNFNGGVDQDVDGSDAFIFKQDFGRSRILDPCTNADPCNGDFECDGDVDGTDAFVFKSDFGRSTILNPCPYCVTIPWCFY